MVSKQPGFDYLMKAIEGVDSDDHLLALTAEYGFHKARKYFLEFDGKKLSSKPLVARAYHLEFPDEDHPNNEDYNGGVSPGSVGRFLMNSGFTVSATKGRDYPPSRLSTGIPEKQLRAISVRRGQVKLRSRLLDVYGGRCAVTLTETEAVLEAAHIVPHAEGGSMEAKNAILLRSDIHLLFDLGLMGIDEEYVVRISDTVASNDYAELDGSKLNLPTDRRDWPDLDALASRMEKLFP